MTYQEAATQWAIDCFGPTITADTIERNHRFVEEALELAQACGATADECHQLVDYVFGRPTGERGQEVGGVMVTLAVLCSAHRISMQDEGDKELHRIHDKIPEIRAKQATKPDCSPLPGRGVLSGVLRTYAVMDGGSGKFTIKATGHERDSAGRLIFNGVEGECSYPVSDDGYAVLGTNAKILKVTMPQIGGTS